MSLAQDMVTYLDSVTALTAGTDLFRGPMPEAPDDCTVCTATGGEEGEYVMGSSLSAPGVEFSRFQLMVRRAAMATAETDAAAYHALLANLGPVTINGRLYHNVESIDGEPYPLGQDQNERYRYVANYRAVKVRG